MRRSALVVLVVLAACAGPGAETPTSTSTEPPSTATTSPRPIVTPTADPPPVGVAFTSACASRARFGDPAESPYVLPFPVGEVHRVIQSYCFGRGGHSQQVAYDFLMPIGSDVLAARGGEVVEVYEDAPDAGPVDANYVFVEHDDGTVAMYAHFGHDGVDVAIGDRVAVGDRLGSSGNSGLGLTDAPHLHFEVYRSWPAVDGADMGINFSNARGPLDLLGGLLQGGVYEALATSVPSHPIVPLGDYSGDDLDGLVLPGVRLWGFDFTRADLSGAVLTGVDLSWARLSHAILVGADLSGANLTGASLFAADLSGAVLAGADMTGIDLVDANLREADLSGVYLLNADLRGADLTGATLAGAIVIGSTYSDATRWPEGFTPPPHP